MTMALFLAMNGRRVTVVEKARTLGGSVARFRRNGIPFDVGFHFTGGLEPGGSLILMLAALGLDGAIEPYYAEGDGGKRFVFEREDARFDLPDGIPENVTSISGSFPREASGIARYFATMSRICAETPAMDIRNVVSTHVQVDEDFISLDVALRALVSDPLLIGLLEAPVTCYGVRPSEIAFANHARMCLDFYRRLAFVKDGGDGFISAFKRRFAELGVETICGDGLAALADVKDGRVGRFVLESGREIAATECVFTIHPHKVLELLPLASFRKGFVERIRSFEPSLGFFCVFATAESRSADLGVETTLGTVFPHAGIDRLFDPLTREMPGPVAIKVGEAIDAAGTSVRPIHLLSLAFPEETAEWDGTRTGRRPAAYGRYKEERVRGIMEAGLKAYPQYRGRAVAVESGSMLTCRDYLNNPDGSAYGIRQKIGQYNMIGQLSLRNLYVAGQSAVMPGILGAMVSSFIVGRALVGADKYREFLEKHCPHGA
jgi:phytoene dehydrogenase-like protein